MIIGGVGILRCFRLSKNKKRLEDYELMQTEERILFLANRSGSMAFRISCCIEALAVFLFLFMEKGEIASVIAYLICGKSFIYLILYYYNNRKY